MQRKWPENSMVTAVAGWRDKRGAGDKIRSVRTVRTALPPPPDTSDMPVKIECNA